MKPKHENDENIIQTGSTLDSDCCPFEKVSENEIDEVRLTESEINSVDHVVSLTDSEIENLKEMVYNLSIVLYKLYHDESA